MAVVQVGEPLVPAFAALGQGAATGLYVLAQTSLLLYASHRHTMWHGGGAPAPRRPPAPAQWPAVCVQLPVYNEPAVIERLIDAAASLDYPADRLGIQVLDDSADVTGSIAAAAVARWRERGIAIEHVRRGERAGYKAGALAHGLTLTDAPLIAVFDADFVPPPTFLRDLVPHFADPAVGMVQARWGHLDRDRSWLTRAQAAMLDSHFLLEHAVRQRRGCFFNFNGTAGLWRRRCIDAAGGWTHDTLTEDLDLSYRAQLAGWRFVYDRDVVVPAELPACMQAFLSQQRRWVTGAIQTARKTLPRILSQPLPASVRLEALFHLTANASYPLLLLLALLLPVVLTGPRSLPLPVVAALHAAVLLLGALPVALFLVAGQRAAGRPWRRAVTDSALALVLGAGMMLSNTRAVFAGLGAQGGVFERTPKWGRHPGGPPPAPAARTAAEMLLAASFAGLLVWAAREEHLSAIPFLALLAAGLGWVGLAPVAAAVRRARRGSNGPMMGHSALGN